MKHKLNKTPEQVLEAIKKCYLCKKIAVALNGLVKMEQGSMDYMCKTAELAIKCGAKTINIPDTVGYTVLQNLKK